MLYLSSFIISWIIIIILLTISIFLDWESFKNPSIFTITIGSLITAISAILTSLISYKIPIFGNNSIRLDFGSFLIFILGMLFGPFFGVLFGIAADTIVFLLGFSGAYNSIYTLDKVLFGFISGLIFLKKNNKWWVFWLYSTYGLTFIITSFGLNSFALYVMFGKSAVIASLIFKVIKAPIEIVIYSSLVLVCFSLLYKLCWSRITIKIWCMKNQGYLLEKLKRHKKNLDDDKIDSSK